MTDAIASECAQRRDYLSELVQTLYFGGGTPSLLSFTQLKQITDAVRNTFSMDPDAEITLEANPDDITIERLHEWRALGINRLSIGVQSFRDEDLLWMNRAHQAQQAIDCIALAKSAGFYNLTIDLIYGIPSLSDEEWLQNVATAIELGVPHLSCYALTVEPKTALEKLIEKQKLPAVDPDRQARHFELLMDRLEASGYEHYEISNFAKPGMRSRHNSSYWQGKPYLGIGPSAHSYNGDSRSWNISNNALYIKGIERNEPVWEQEMLTTAEKVNEIIMTSLRTIEGLSLERIRQEYGVAMKNQVATAAQRHLNAGLLKEDEGSLKTTRNGKLMADGIAADLFID